MKISFDPEKNAKNIRQRNLSFERAVEFEFGSASVVLDARHDYGERRYVAVGLLHGRLHVLCFTETNDGIRVISFRRANDREIKRHAKIQTID